MNLGKVRSLQIKRTARELIEKYPDRFSTDFQHNKKILNEILERVGKPIRNRIAGYITTLLKQGKEK